MSPVISVYSVFNAYPVNYLADAIHSLVTQTYTEYEYVFLIYGPDNQTYLDGVLRVLDRLPFPVNIYYQPEITDFISAITFAIGKCTGQYVCRLDCDDLIMPQALLRMLTRIQQTDASMVIGNYRIIGRNSEIKGDENRWVCHALIERDKYHYVKYLPGQTFRDGTSLLKAFRQYGFKIVDLDYVTFLHREHGNNITKDQTKVKTMDQRIMETDLYAI